MGPHGFSRRNTGNVAADRNLTIWGRGVKLGLVYAAMPRLARYSRGLSEPRDTDPADIINSATDGLIRHDFELPPLATLRRLAGTSNSKTNSTQWDEVCGHLSLAQRSVLEILLGVDPKTHKSLFANLCTTPGSPSRKNLNALIDRYQWLEQPPNPATPHQTITDSKILQWANEDRRLMHLNCGST